MVKAALTAQEAAKILKTLTAIQEAEQLEVCRVGERGVFRHECVCVRMAWMCCACNSSCGVGGGV